MGFELTTAPSTNQHCCRKDSNYLQEKNGTMLDLLWRHQHAPEPIWLNRHRSWFYFIIQNPWLLWLHLITTGATFEWESATNERFGTTTFFRLTFLRRTENCNTQPDERDLTTQKSMTKVMALLRAMFSILSASSRCSYTFRKVVTAGGNVSVGKMSRHHIDQLFLFKKIIIVQLKLKL